MTNYYVYEHWRPDKDCCFYVGIGSEYRTKDVKRNRFHTYIRRKLERQGLTIDVRVVGKNLSVDVAKQMEVDLIRFYGRRDLGTGNLVNLTDGGDGTPNPREEHRLKISVAMKGNKNTAGRPLTADHRKKISVANRGHKNFLGGKHTAETKRKLSEVCRRTWLGRKHTEEARRRQSMVHTGCRLTEETKEKISIAHKGIRPDEKTRQKLSMARKLWWEKKKNDELACGSG